MKLVIIDTFHLQRVIIPAEVIPDMFVVIIHYRRRPVDVEIMEKYQFKHDRLQIYCTESILLDKGLGKPGSMLKIALFNGQIPVSDWMHDFARYDIIVVP